MWSICVLPGDGIGPEIVAEALKVIKATGELYGHSFQITEKPIGGAALDEVGTPLPEDTLSTVIASDAVLFGAVGGPQWDTNPPHLRPGAGLRELRKTLNLYANLRPILRFPALAGHGPIHPEIASIPFDIMIVRELTSGLYYGQPKGMFRDDHGMQYAVDTMRYTEQEADRLLNTAFRLARKRRKSLLYAGKIGVLRTSDLWWERARHLAQVYDDVELSYLHVDALLIHMLRSPHKFDVIATTNHMGDIISELGGVLGGSLGMMPSASLGDKTPGLFEPIHGSAPDIAGKNIANPIGTILSVAMMFEYGFGLIDEASAIRQAVNAALDEGVRTADIATPGIHTPVSTSEIGDAIVEKLSQVKETSP